MKNKTLDVDNYFDKPIGEGKKRMSISKFSIKGDSEIFFVSA